MSGLISDRLEVRAKGKMIKSSVRKLNLVASLIRGQKVSVAMTYLEFCRKKTAFDVKQVLSSAIANAQCNYNLDIDNLYVAEVLVGKSLVLYRVRPRAMGKAHKIRKRYSCVTIKLLERS